MCKCAVSVTGRWCRRAHTVVPARLAMSSVHCREAEDTGRLRQSPSRRKHVEGGSRCLESSRRRGCSRHQSCTSLRRSASKPATIAAVQRDGTLHPEGRFRGVRRALPAGRCGDMGSSRIPHVGSRHAEGGSRAADQPRALILHAKGGELPRPMKACGVIAVGGHRNGGTELTLMQLIMSACSVGTSLFPETSRLARIWELPAGPATIGTWRKTGQWHPMRLAWHARAASANASRRWPRSYVGEGMRRRPCCPQSTTRSFLRGRAAPRSGASEDEALSGRQ